jgi:hypothetical protein
MNMAEFTAAIANEFVSLDDAATSAVLNFEVQADVEDACDAIMARFNVPRSEVLTSMKHHATEHGINSVVVKSVFALINQYGEGLTPVPDQVEAQPGVDPVQS